MDFKELLSEFLGTTLANGDSIFDKFADLPGAVVGKGNTPLERYVYIPGTRDDRVVLVAHTDTVWDVSYGNTALGENKVVFSEGVFSGENESCGIGADDRAGCAMLWALRDCGHSILVVDGEEHGKLGARCLKKTNKKLFRELNRHCYMIEFDWAGTDGCLFNQVENTKRFKKYIADELGFKDSKKRGGTDLQILCDKVCGVNLGIGYHHCHSKNETLVLREWENTYKKVSRFLAGEQKRFRTSFFGKCITFLKRCARKVKRTLKKAS